MPDKVTPSRRAWGHRSKAAVPEPAWPEEDGRLWATSLPGAGTPPPLAMVFPRALAVTFQVQLPLIGRWDSAGRRDQHRG